MLDKDFQPAKNIVNDALCFDLRVDVDRLPADKMKAYYEVELKALSSQNPSGLPTAKQKREAKEAARGRLEEEAKDGRYKKSKCIPIMWDAVSNEVLLGATSPTHVDRLVSLFQQTFGYGLEPVSAGKRAIGSGDASCSTFVEGSTGDAAWVPDDTSRDFLGNEFILWLWYFSDTVSDTVQVGEGSEITFMLARSLVLDCPRGQTDRSTFKHGGPSRLPEAKRAVKSGKLPRKVGPTIVRRGEQFEFALSAESLGVGGATVPRLPEDVTQARAKLEERVRMIRDLSESVDLLCGKFFRIRLTNEWAETLAEMRGWLVGADPRNREGWPIG